MDLLPEETAALALVAFAGLVATLVAIVEDIQIRRRSPGAFSTGLVRRVRDTPMTTPFPLRTHNVRRSRKIRRAVSLKEEVGT